MNYFILGNDPLNPDKGDFIFNMVNPKCTIQVAHHPVLEDKDTIQYEDYGFTLVLFDHKPGEGPFKEIMDEAAKWYHDIKQSELN